MGWKDDDDDGTRVDVGEMIHETDLAALYEIDGDEVWIPKSVILDEDEDEGFIMVKSWFAAKEGLA